MAWIGKKYTLYKSENFEEYLEALGVGWFFRKLSSTLNPTISLTQDGDWYQFHTESTFRTTTLRFKLNEEFEEEMKDGREIKTVMTLEGNTLTQTQQMDKPAKVVREFSDTECVTTATYGDIVSKRWYKVE